MDISNIDDLLMGGKTATQPATPEHQYDSEEIEELEPKQSESPDNIDYDVEDDETELQNDTLENKKETNDDEIETNEDDYGNKTEQLSKSMQKRLERQAESLKRKHELEILSLRQQLEQQGASQQVQQAAKDFEYDPNDDGTWQQQLASFVKQTVSQMHQDERRFAQEQEEKSAHQEFAKKFTQGMDRFDDFTKIVANQPIDDAMTLALRGMEDPAAFIYAASKRQPQELERISKLRDPYARMVEMGKLEERMRKNKPTTKAPKPLGRIKDDGKIPSSKEKREDTIEDLIAKSESKKLARLKAIRGK